MFPLRYTSLSSFRGRCGVPLSGVLLGRDCCGNRTCGPEVLLPFSLWTTQRKVDLPNTRQRYRDSVCLCTPLSTRLTVRHDYRSPSGPQSRSREVVLSRPVPPPHSVFLTSLDDPPLLSVVRLYRTSVLPRPPSSRPRSRSVTVLDRSVRGSHCATTGLGSRPRRRCRLSPGTTPFPLPSTPPSSPLPVRTLLEIGIPFFLSLSVMIFSPFRSFSRNSPVTLVRTHDSFQDLPSSPVTPSPLLPPVPQGLLPRRSLFPGRKVPGPCRGWNGVPLPFRPTTPPSSSLGVGDFDVVGGGWKS